MEDLYDRNSDLFTNELIDTVCNALSTIPSNSARKLFHCSQLLQFPTELEVFPTTAEVSNLSAEHKEQCIS